MDDLISRQAAIDIAYPFDDNERNLIDALEELPTADVRENVKGEWIKLDMHAHLADHKCSACGQECYVPTCMGDPMYVFCPNCGAQMER